MLDETTRDERSAPKQMTHPGHHASHATCPTQRVHLDVHSHFFRTSLSILKATSFHSASNSSCSAYSPSQVCLCFPWLQLRSVFFCFCIPPKKSKLPLAMKCFFLRFLPLLILETDGCLPPADQLPPAHFLPVLLRIIDVCSRLVITLLVCFCLHHCRFFIVVFPCYQLLCSLFNVFHLRLIHCVSSRFCKFRTVDFLHEIF